MNIVGFTNCTEKDIKYALEMCMKKKKKYKKDDAKWTILDFILFIIPFVGLVIAPSFVVLFRFEPKMALLMTSLLNFALYFLITLILFAWYAIGLLSISSVSDFVGKIVIPKKIRKGHLAYQCLRDDCKNLEEILQMYSLCEDLTQSMSYASFDEDTSCISLISHNGKYGMLEHKTYKLTDEMKKNIFLPDEHISFEHYDQEYVDIVESTKIWL